MSVFGVLLALWSCLPMAAPPVSPVAIRAVVQDAGAEPGDDATDDGTRADDALADDAAADDGTGAELGARAERFRTGLELWRRGERALAESAWLDLARELPPAPEPGHGGERVFDRVALFHALGNAAYRAERPLAAVGWYERGLRHRPRDPELLANRRLARIAAELDPEDQRQSALVELLRSVSRGEARWLALLGLVPLAFGLLAEALRGGRVGRGLAALGVLAAGAAAAPYLHARLGPPPPDLLVVAPGGAGVHSEPNAASERVAELPAGSTTSEVERWPGWVRVRVDEDLRAWLPEAAVFPLDL